MQNKEETEENKTETWKKRPKKRRTAQLQLLRSADKFLTKVECDTKALQPPPQRPLHRRQDC